MNTGASAMLFTLVELQNSLFNTTWITDKPTSTGIQTLFLKTNTCSFADGASQVC